MKTKNLFRIAVNVCTDYRHKQIPIVISQDQILYPPGASNCVKCH